MKMLEFRNVSKSFWTGRQRRVILLDASFEIPFGHNVGVLAPNGAGKTTLINMIAGFEPADEGEIVRHVRFGPPIGFAGALAGKLTGRENVRYAATIHGLDPDEVLTDCIDFARIDEYIDMPVATYSSGMRARLAFALSMAMNYDVVLVDEAMSVGDKDFRERSRRMLVERLKPTSLFMVSHNPQTLREFCDAAAVLRHGKVHYFDRLEDAKALYDFGE